MCYLDLALFSYLVIVLTPTQFSENHLNSQDSDQIAEKQASVILEFPCRSTGNPWSTPQSWQARAKMTCLDVMPVCPGDPTFPPLMSRQWKSIYIYYNNHVPCASLSSLFIITIYLYNVWGIPLMSHHNNIILYNMVIL